MMVAYDWTSGESYVDYVYGDNSEKEKTYQKGNYYSLTMDQINQVVVKHLIGNSQNNGGPPEATDVWVIYLNLKDSALRGPNLNFLNINLNGYYSARAFYAPTYTATASSNKDLRTTLFWAPLLKTNDMGELSVSFFNGDNTGEMIIKTNGITANGTAVSAKSTYKVQ